MNTFTVIKNTNDITQQVKSFMLRGVSDGLSFEALTQSVNKHLKSIDNLTLPCVQNLIELCQKHDIQIQKSILDDYFSLQSKISSYLSN